MSLPQGVGQAKHLTQKNMCAVSLFEDQCSTLGLAYKTYNLWHFTRHQADVVCYMAVTSHNCPLITATF